MLLRGILLSAILWGKRASTTSVVRVVSYENTTDCTGGVEQTAEYFGIPDSFGILEFDVCHGSNGSYVQYVCNSNASVVYNLYTDANCTEAMDGVDAGEASDAMCRNGQTSHCDASDADYSASSPNFTVAAIVYSDSSCTVWGGTLKKYSMEDYTNPITGSSGTCSPSELYDFNTKLVCVDNEVKTFYYEKTDTNCSSSSPTAVATTTPCLMLDEGLYHSASCVDSSVAEHDEFQVETDDATTTSTYTHFEVYSTPTCSVKESDMHYLGFPSGADTLFVEYGAFGQATYPPPPKELDPIVKSRKMFMIVDKLVPRVGFCKATNKPMEATVINCDGGGGYSPYNLCHAYDGMYAMLSCDSEDVFLSVYASDSCSAASEYVTANLSYGGSCNEGMIMSCSTTVPAYEGTLDEWEISVVRQDNSACSSNSSSTDDKEVYTWAEFLSSGIVSDDSSESSEGDSLDTSSSNDPGSGFCDDGYQFSYNSTNSTESASSGLWSNDTGIDVCADGYSFDNGTETWWSTNGQSTSVDGDHSYYNGTGGYWCFPETYYNSTGGFWCRFSTGGDWGSTSGMSSSGSLFSSDLSFGSAPSVSCSPLGDAYNSMVQCVDETIKLVIYSGGDTNCSATPEIVMSVPTCTEELDDSYVHISCVSAFNDDPPNAADALSPYTYLWISGGTTAAVGTFLLSGLML